MIGDRTDNTLGQLNTLATQSAHTVVESITLTQRQSAEFLQRWIDVVQTNQQVSREITGKLMEQVQQVGTAWQQLIRENVRTGVETLGGVNRGPQIDEAVERIDGINEQVRASALRAETAAKRASETLQAVEKLTQQLTSAADRVESLAKRAEKVQSNLEQVSQHVADSTSKRATKETPTTANEPAPAESSKAAKPSTSK